MIARSLARRLGNASLVAGGAFAIHQLRYALVYGDEAGDVLALHGHAYLDLVTPLIAGSMVLALTPFLALIGGGARPAPAAPGSFSRLWLSSSLCLLLLYVGQESVESLFNPGHPHGLAAAFGHGGWSTLPLALAVGALVAVARRGAAVAEELLAPATARWFPRRQPITVDAVPESPLCCVPAPRVLSARGPPL